MSGSPTVTCADGVKAKARATRDGYRCTRRPGRFTLLPRLMPFLVPTVTLPEPERRAGAVRLISLRQRGGRVWAMGQLDSVVAVSAAPSMSHVVLHMPKSCRSRCPGNNAMRYVLWEQYTIEQLTDRHGGPPSDRKASSLPGHLLSPVFGPFQLVPLHPISLSTSTSRTRSTTRSTTRTRTRTIASPPLHP